MYKKNYSFLLLGLCFLTTIPLQSSLNPFSLKSRLNSLLKKGKNKEDITEEIINFKFTENDINELTGKNCSQYKGVMMKLQKKINFNKGYTILKKDYPDSANNIKAVLIKMLRPNQYKRLSDFINTGRFISAKSMGELQDELDFLYQKNKNDFNETFADTVDMVMLGAGILPWNAHFFFSIEMNQLYKQLSDCDRAPFLAKFGDLGPGEQILSDCKRDNFEHPYDKTESGELVAKTDPYPYLTKVLSYLKNLREREYDSALINSLMYHYLLIYNQYTSMRDLENYFAKFFSDNPTQEDIQPPVPDNINVIYEDWKKEYENYSLNQPEENMPKEVIIQPKQEEKVIDKNPLVLSDLLKEEGDITEKVITLELTQQEVEKIIADNPDLLTNAQKRINYSKAYETIDASYKKAINIKTFYEKTLRYSIYSKNKDEIDFAQQALDFLFYENSKISPEFAHAMESVLLGCYFLYHTKYGTVSLDNVFKFILSCSNLFNTLKEQEKEIFLNTLKTIHTREQCITLSEYKENNQKNEIYDFPLETSYQTRVLDYLRTLKNDQQNNQRDAVLSTMNYFIRLYFVETPQRNNLFRKFFNQYLTKEEREYQLKFEHRKKLDIDMELLKNRCDNFIKSIRDKKRNNIILGSVVGIGLGALLTYYINKHAATFKKIPEFFKNRLFKKR